jgi:hypothetical protein
VNNENLWNLEVHVIITYDILAVNRLPEDQPLLDYKQLRHSLPGGATVSVVYHSTSYNQKANNEATHYATCYRPSTAFG